MGVVARSLAEQLLVLCWDDQQGAVHRACWKTVDVAVAGGLVAQAVTLRVITVGHGRIHSTGPALGDPLLAEVVTAVQRRGVAQPPRVRTVVDQLSSPRRRRRVRDRLVNVGVLRAQRRRVLGLVPTTRFPVADEDTAAAVRDHVRALATGRRDPGEADIRERRLVGLAKAVRALDLIVAETEREAAHRHVEELTAGDDVVDAVAAAAFEAQAVLVGGP